jgi:acetate kinase
VILVLNGGSSSLKFELFDVVGEDVVARLSGQVEGIGATPVLRVGATRAPIDGDSHSAALTAILSWLDTQGALVGITAVGHRVVHGGPQFDRPLRIDAAAMEALRALVPLAPLHQPHNLAGIEAAAARFPKLPQVACFDTAFHRTHPWVADTFALPPEFHERGIRRYGFHGLSYEWIVRALAAEDPVLARGRLVVAHLGNGASLCAIADGRSGCPSAAHPAR